MPAPAETVWETIRDFDSIDEWHPVITNCTIEDGKASNEIGAVRNFQAGDKELREQLVAHSDVERSYHYTIVEGAGPKENYLSKISVIPITESDEALVEWWGEFDAPAAEMEAQTEGTKKVYSAGLNNLHDQLK